MAGGVDAQPHDRLASLSVDDRRHEDCDVLADLDALVALA